MVAMGAADRINEESPDGIAARWVSEVSGLVSPPEISTRLLELARSPDSSAGEMGKVISHDPNLTARLLKLVNSALYNFPNKIDTVSRAISIAGTRELYNLVIAVTAIRSFSNIPVTLVNMDTFWRHSLFCGILARELGRRCRMLHPERMFVAGLLHDVGSLVCFYQAPEVSRELILTSEGDEDCLHRAERSAFGFSHADLGCRLLETWSMQASVIDAVRHHHAPDEADGKQLEAWILHLADRLANRSQLGALLERAGDQGDANSAAWEALGLSPGADGEERLIGEAGLQFTDIVSTLLPRGTARARADRHSGHTPPPRVERGKHR